MVQFDKVSIFTESLNEIFTVIMSSSNQFKYYAFILDKFLLPGTDSTTKAIPDFFLQTLLLLATSSILSTYVTEEHQHC